MPDSRQSRKARVSRIVNSDVIVLIIAADAFRIPKSALRP
jgi:hypothetical protein